MRYGLVGILDGDNWKLAERLPIDVWLARPIYNSASGIAFVRQYRKDLHPTADVILCPQGRESSFQKFLKQIDTVVYYRDCCFRSLLPIAEQQGKRIIRLESLAGTLETQEQDSEI